MKSIYLLALIISTLCISVISADQAKTKAIDDVAELKLSLSTYAINKLIAFLGVMVDNLNQGAVVKIPLDLNLKGKWNLYTVELNNLKLANHTVNWNKDAISINTLDANTFQVQINGVSLNFTGFEDITFLKFIQIKNNFTLTLTDLTFLTTASLTPSDDSNSIGFIRKRSPTSLTLDSLYINLEDQKIFNYMLKAFTWILKHLKSHNQDCRDTLVDVGIDPKMNTKIVLLLVSLCVFVAAQSTPASRIQFEFQIESICPDCMNFIQKSVTPALKVQNFLEVADITFYPYGNASRDPKTGEVDCQHGPNECYGNKIEACGGKYITDSLTNFQFIICIEKNIKTYYPNFNKALSPCGKDKSMNLSADTDKKISSDANSVEGDAIIAKIADKTDSLVPKYTYDPWVVINGVHDTADEDQVIENLQQYTYI